MTYVDKVLVDMPKTESIYTRLTIFLYSSVRTSQRSCEFAKDLVAGVAKGSANPPPPVEEFAALLQKHPSAFHPARTAR